MNPPAFQSRHAAAQERGEFTPYPKPMKPHPQSIVIPPHRATNRRKHSRARRGALLALLFLAACIAWGLGAYAIL